jgi:hypothetical protein
MQEVIGRALLNAESHEIGILTDGKHVLTAKLSIQPVKSVTEGREELRKKILEFSTERKYKGGCGEIVVECKSVD